MQKSFDGMAGVVYQGVSNKESDMTAEQMRHAIMNQVTCTDGTVTRDMWFSLIFASDETLRKICRELRIA